MKKIIFLSLLSFVVSYAPICSEHEAAQDFEQLREFCERISEIEKELKDNDEVPSVTTETLEILEPEITLSEEIPSIPQNELAEAKEIIENLGDVALVSETPVIENSVDFIPEDTIEVELEDDDEESMQ